MSVVLAIFSRQPNASLLADFPPKVVVVPIIPEVRGRQEREEQMEFAAEATLRGNVVNQPNAPISNLEIPVFEGEKPW